MVHLKCKNCGSDKFRQIDNHTFECKYCGVLVRKKFGTKMKENKHQNIMETTEKEKQIKQENNKNNNFSLVKLLLCIFFGYYGVHRFVEGKIGTGLLFLFTYGLFGIGYICDIFRLAKEVAGQNNNDSETKENE